MAKKIQKIKLSDNYLQLCLNCVPVLCVFREGTVEME